MTKKIVPNLGNKYLSTDFRKAFSSIEYYIECNEANVNARTKYLSKRNRRRISLIFFKTLILRGTLRVNLNDSPLTIPKNVLATL